MKTIIDHVGWNDTDLDKSGSFCKVDFDKSLKSIVLKSLCDSRRVVKIDSVIKEGDFLVFSKALSFQKTEVKFTLNPIIWFVWCVELIYSLFKRKYKRLNSIGVSISRFNNPSQDVNDFPYEKPLEVEMIVSRLDDMRYEILGSLFISLKDGENRWMLSFDVFSYITLIGIEKSTGSNVFEGDESNDNNFSMNNEQISVAESNENIDEDKDIIVHNKFIDLKEKSTEISGFVILSCFAFLAVVSVLLDYHFNGDLHWDVASKFFGGYSLFTGLIIILFGKSSSYSPLRLYVIVTILCIGFAIFEASNEGVLFKERIKHNQLEDIVNVAQQIRMVSERGEQSNQQNLDRFPKYIEKILRTTEYRLNNTTKAHVALNDVTSSDDWLLATDPANIADSKGVKPRILLEALERSIDLRKAIELYYDKIDINVKTQQARAFVKEFESSRGRLHPLMKSYVDLKFKIINRFVRLYDLSGNHKMFFNKNTGSIFFADEDVREEFFSVLYDIDEILAEESRILREINSIK